MIFHEIDIRGAFLIELERKEDARGFFARVWSSKKFAERGLVSRFVEWNMSYTRKRGQIRGLHYQAPPHEETKLMRCTRGAIYDVIVDVRPNSPTRYRWTAIELHASEYSLLYVPGGCAHGFQSLEDDTEVVYPVSAYYAPQAERGLRWDDPFFGIEWPEPSRSIVSEKDSNWPDFRVEEAVDE